MSRSDRLKIAVFSIAIALLAYFHITRPPATVPRRPAPELPAPEAEVGVSSLGGGLERDNRVLGEFDLARVFPNLVLRQGDVKTKTVALTFDDGPDRQYTPKILDVLAQKGVRATFFLIGKRLNDAPEVVRRIVSEGHDVGNHTHTHPNVTAFTGAEIESEIKTADRELEKFGVKKTGMFRPPYGAVGVSSVEHLAGAGYKLYLWSVDSLDWRGLKREQVINNVLPLTANGAVILFHSAGGPGEDLSGTVEALPMIIDELTAKGFRFVTLREMFPPG